MLLPNSIMESAIKVKYFPTRPVDSLAKHMRNIEKTLTVR